MRRLLPRLLVTLIAVAVAIGAGWQLWIYYMRAPWTRDGRVLADVVALAPDVSGPVVEVLVQDNQMVRQGDVLFRVDPARFRLALEQADAQMASREAVLAESIREARRYQALTRTEVSQEQVQKRAALAEENAASLRQAQADRDLAQLNLDRTEVKATVNGMVTNFTMRPGDYVTTGQAVLALVDYDSFHATGYFEETKLPRIQVGDRARIQMMGEHGLIDGHVESIAGGISNSEVAAGEKLLPTVNPTFAWVRLAQRIPVRIALDRVPEGTKLVSGRTATIEVLR
jgi:multidrug resistance efflux pump